MPVPRRADPRENALIQHIVSHCREEGVIVQFYSTRNYVGTKRSGTVGSFDGVNKVLRVTCRVRNWLWIFIHEYCHFLQLLDGTPWYGTQAENHWHRFDRWVDDTDPGKDRLDRDKVEESTRVIQACEMDAERRTIDLIKKWDLSKIDLDVYRRKANVYILSYEAARMCRTWHTKKHPCRTQELLKLVPSHRFVRRDRLHCLPEGFLDAYWHVCC